MVLSPIAYDGTRTPLKTVLFVVVCLAWLLPGLVGHDPWKLDEAVVFGVVSEMVRTGDWISFRIAGEPFLDKAPLFIWTSAAFAKVLGGLIPLHDAARWDTLEAARQDLLSDLRQTHAAERYRAAS